MSRGKRLIGWTAVMAVGALGAAEARAQRQDMVQADRCQLGAASCPKQVAAAASDAEEMVVGPQLPFDFTPLPHQTRAPATAPHLVTAPPRPTLATGHKRPMLAGPAEPRRPVGVLDTKLTFANGSADLSPAAKQRLSYLAHVILDEPSLAAASYRIDGHTNSVGARAANLDLSQRRANAVVDYLVSLGMPRTQIEAAGHGPDMPLSGSDPADAANRRVEIAKK